MRYIKLLNLYNNFYIHYYSGKTKKNLTPKKIVYLFILLKVEYMKKKGKKYNFDVYQIDGNFFIPYLSDYLNIVGICPYTDRVGRNIFEGLDNLDYKFFDNYFNKSEKELKELIEALAINFNIDKDFRYYFFKIRSYIFSKKRLLEFTFFYKRVIFLMVSLLEAGLIIMIPIISILNSLGRNDESLGSIIFIGVLNTLIYIYMYIRWLILPPKKKVKKKKKRKIKRKQKI